MKAKAKAKEALAAAPCRKGHCTKRRSLEIKAWADSRARVPPFLAKCTPAKEERGCRREACRVVTRLQRPQSSLAAAFFWAIRNLTFSNPAHACQIVGKRRDPRFEVRVEAAARRPSARFLGRASTPSSTPSRGFIRNARQFIRCSSIPLSHRHIVTSSHRHITHPFGSSAVGPIPPSSTSPWLSALGSPHSKRASAQSARNRSSFAFPSCRRRFGRLFPACRASAGTDILPSSSQ